MIKRGSFAATLCVVSFVLLGCEPTVETVEATSDQTELASIAVEAKDSDVRLAAAQKLTDQALLATIAAKDKALTIRLSNPNTYFDCALGGGSA